MAILEAAVDAVARSLGRPTAEIRAVSLLTASCATADGVPVRAHDAAILQSGVSFFALFFGFFLFSSAREAVHFRSLGWLLGF